ncbi:hypothetical protein [Pseudodesulfovibrio karagichevae]|uniref:Solute-binding protein family 3/N-terminal domain-containing protein n=1 Tax=Pseudodesulfovibrio karagichevae TaxID=3239305 RepID=A0ABV4K0X5_9BACT
MRNRLLHTLVLLAVLAGTTGTAHAMDRLVLPADTSPLDTRWRFPLEVLTRAMMATEDTDGPFCIGRYRLPMHFDRALAELGDGKSINVSIATASREWDEKALPVRVPIFRGVKSYRLLLVNSQSLDRFRDVRTMDDFRRLKGGVVYQWISEDILDRTGCALVRATSYEGLFSMLAARRFDYIPSSLSDCYREASTRTVKNPDLRVEPTLALYIPCPQFFYVSPAFPGLADRIRRGMAILDGNGTLDRMFHDNFDETIRRADLNHRRIIRIDNPNLPDGIPPEDPVLHIRP